MLLSKIVFYPFDIISIRECNIANLSVRGGCKIENRNNFKSLHDASKRNQFVTFLEEPDSDVIVFYTAPTGKTLRELAMPFDWAGFLQKQIQEGKKLAQLMNMDSNAFEDL